MLNKYDHFELNCLENKKNFYSRKCPWFSIFPAKIIDNLFFERTGCQSGPVREHLPGFRSFHGAGSACGGGFRQPEQCGVVPGVPQLLPVLHDSLRLH